MDFDDTAEEAAFRREAREWLDQNAEPLAAGESPSSFVDEDTAGSIVERAKAWQARKADGGWACITWPVEYGGRAASAIQSVIWNQEEARYRTPPNIFTIGQGMLGPTIMAHGSEAQKQRYLNKMLRGEEIWSQLFSEPDAGSDLAALRMSARREIKEGSGDPAGNGNGNGNGDGNGDEASWILNGQKIWTTGAQFSDFGMVLTRTDPDANKHAGITYFIVDMKSPGIEIRPIRQMNGASGFNEVFFQDVRVPDRNRVGAVNDGWRGAITTLMNERAAIGGGVGGLGMGELVRLAKSIPRGEGSAFDDPAVRQRLAEFSVRSSGLTYTTYRTLTALSQGRTPGPEGAIGKLVGAPMRQDMAAFALELLAEAGVALDPATDPSGGAWAQMYLAAPGLRLAGGTDEILRNIISERVLGLPGEIRVDKDRPFSDVPTGRARH